MFVVAARLLIDNLGISLVPTDFGQNGLCTHGDIFMVFAAKADTFAQFTFVCLFACFETPSGCDRTFLCCWIICACPVELLRC